MEKLPIYIERNLSYKKMIEVQVIMPPPHPTPPYPIPTHIPDGTSVSVGVGVKDSWVYDLSRTNQWIFIRTARKYHWVMLKWWKDFGEFDLTFKVIVLKRRSNMNQNRLCVARLLNRWIDLGWTCIDTSQREKTYILTYAHKKI